MHDMDFGIDYQELITQETKKRIDIIWTGETYETREFNGLFDNQYAITLY